MQVPEKAMIESDQGIGHRCDGENKWGDQPTIQGSASSQTPSITEEAYGSGPVEPQTQLGGVGGGLGAHPSVEGIPGNGGRGMVIGGYCALQWSVVEVTYGASDGIRR